MKVGCQLEPGQTQLPPLVPVKMTQSATQICQSGSSSLAATQSCVWGPPPWWQPPHQLQPPQQTRQGQLALPPQPTKLQDQLSLSWSAPPSDQLLREQGAWQEYLRPPHSEEPLKPQPQQHAQTQPHVAQQKYQQQELGQQTMSPLEAVAQVAWRQEQLSSAVSVQPGVEHIVRAQQQQEQKQLLPEAWQEQPPQHQQLLGLFVQQQQQPQQSEEPPSQQQQQEQQDGTTEPDQESGMAQSNDKKLTEEQLALIEQRRQKALSKKRKRAADTDGPQDSRPQCVICQADMLLAEDRLMLPRGHTFHRECVEKYATKKGVQVEDACPLRCRTTSQGQSSGASASSASTSIVDLVAQAEAEAERMA